MQQLRQEREQHKANTDVRAELTACEGRCYQLTIELNAAGRKCDSLSRELKKLMKESRETQYAFEVALDRKSVECIVSVCSVGGRRLAHYPTAIP